MNRYSITVLSLLSLIGLTLFFGVSAGWMADMSITADLIILALLFVAAIVIGIICVGCFLFRHEVGRAILLAMTCFLFLFGICAILHYCGIDVAVIDLVP